MNSVNLLDHQFENGNRLVLLIEHGKYLLGNMLNQSQPEDLTHLTVCYLERATFPYNDDVGWDTIGGEFFALSQMDQALMAFAIRKANPEIAFKPTSSQTLEMVERINQFYSYVVQVTGPDLSQAESNQFKSELAEHVDTLIKSF